MNFIHEYVSNDTNIDVSDDGNNDDKDVIYDNHIISYL